MAQPSINKSSKSIIFLGVYSTGMELFCERKAIISLRIKEGTEAIEG
jgi:hypothetical protein